MMEGQLIPAFMAALLKEGVEPQQIERAVARVRDLKLGTSITNDPLVRAFVFEQQGLLKRALK